MKMPLKTFPEIKEVIQGLKPENLSIERKALLQPLIGFIRHKIEDSKHIRLNFICTHNSRRSHLSQVWAQTMAAYCDIENVFCYSGGTEATALFPMVAETLSAKGFQIETLSKDTNPVYSIKFGADAHPIIGFSKRFDAHFNPQSEFAAVMTCTQADEGCPFIPGAEIRISLPYEDPKTSDNTPLQREMYRERSLQIATELFYVFSKIKA